MRYIDSEFQIEEYSDTLDQFSTSPTDAFKGLVLSLPRCEYGAPYFAFQRGGLHYGVVQGCCNHWECKRCGILVAKQHYGRIVEGCRAISKISPLWFITITCRGKDLSEAEATKMYLAWTSKFLDACYSKSKREGKDWYYVQVTEKQKRGHPHSHILASFAPTDIHNGSRQTWKHDNLGNVVSENVSALRSDWMQAQVIRSGLGEQYDISKVETVEGASRYVAKYMFKESQFQSHYPKGWKRVRYSQSFPKQPRIKTDAFVLLSISDWHRLAQNAAVVDAESGDAYESALFFLRQSDTIVTETRSREVDDSEKNSYADKRSHHIQH